MNFIKSFFGLREKVTMTPHEFIEKFVFDSKRKHVQLELYYSKKVILQLESLKHVPIWTDWCNVGLKDYRNGYVCHFFLKKKNLSKNKFYDNYKGSKDFLDMVEYEDDDYGIINFVHFFKKGTRPIDIGKYMRKVIDNVYKFPEENPQIGFNLRYLKRKE
ncbi:hypothetical protein L0P88_08815 [Muricauda sp. SCSIO 64092]|uniref:hypothetical protein n=1 Tax=Allomuricauda sp. SCSIO 64092 TaxID=2908842 RepID=UPI001FF4628C|nr:hypothetical protein [Muricauda sp. SCSIO 64092]UOY08640.1 hypothetical protein L0P88_08815 [Muricauda sp. SCSIO 64092]